MNDEPRDVRLPLMVSRSEAEAIDAWRYANRVPTRADAIRRLIELGLQAHGTAAEPVSARQPGPRAVGPEDEARGGHEAACSTAGPTVPGTSARR